MACLKGGSSALPYLPIQSTPASIPLSHFRSFSSPSSARFPPASARSPCAKPLKPARLFKHTSSAIRRTSRGRGIAISAITLWELAWHAGHGRLDGNCGSIPRRSFFACFRPPYHREVTAKVAALGHQFRADYPGDLCDRINRSDSLGRGQIVASKDAEIRACRLLQTLWLNTISLYPLCGIGTRPYREREDSSTTPASPRSLAKYWS